MTGQEIQLQVTRSDVRLDRFLADESRMISRSRWQALIKGGLVLVDGQVVRQPAAILSGGEIISAEIPAPKAAPLQPESIALEILYEDDQLIAVNKPAGMVVHPSAGHSSGTLVHAVLAHDPDIKGVGGERRPGVVHRLDKGTSGVIVLAKDDETHQWLQDQFKRRAVAKDYLALVDGRPPSAEGVINAPINRHKTQRKRMAVVPEGQGRDAVTVFRTLEVLERHTLLLVEPRTGRTHQIRVHLEYIGAPVTGDRVYGRSKPSIRLERPFLHALKLTIPRPDRIEPWSFRAPLPEDLGRVLAELGSRWEIDSRGVG